MNKSVLVIFILGFISCSQEKSSKQIPVEGFPLQVTGTVIQHDSIPSMFIKVRPVSVWLPQNYSESEKSYPVVYFMDGQNIFDPKTSFIGVDWSIDEWADSLMKANLINEAIFVGVWNTSERGPEYFPQKAFDFLSEKEKVQLVKRYENFEPKADAFLSYLSKEIKPFIDKTYRTKTDQKNTHIGGSSMGALISLYALSEYPDLFYTAICVSTHWPIVEGLTLEYFRDRLPVAGNHRIYFDYGTKTLDETYEPYQKKMDEIMIQKGYSLEKDWVTIKFEGHEHSERDWRKRVDSMLKFALATSPN